MRKERIGRVDSEGRRIEQSSGLDVCLLVRPANTVVDYAAVLLPACPTVEMRLNGGMANPNPNQPDPAFPWPFLLAFPNMASSRIELQSNQLQYT